MRKNSPERAEFPGIRLFHRFHRWLLIFHPFRMSNLLFGEDSIFKPLSLSDCRSDRQAPYSIETQTTINKPTRNPEQRKPPRHNEALYNK